MRAAFFSLIVLAACAAAQDESSRAIWDQNFREKRPASTRQNATPPGQVLYKPALPSARPKQQTPSEASARPLVGVTFWKGRLATASDEDSPRLLVPMGPPSSAGRKQVMVPE